jgi:hypothetical protein
VGSPGEAGQHGLRMRGIIWFAQHVPVEHNSRISAEHNRSLILGPDGIRFAPCAQGRMFAEGEGTGWERGDNLNWSRIVGFFGIRNHDGKGDTQPG